MLVVGTMNQQPITGLVDGIYYVEIEKVLGPVKGVGWLCFTKQGNFVLVVPGEGFAFERCIFILDREWLERLADAAGFIVQIPEGWNGIQQEQ